MSGTVFSVSVDCPCGSEEDYRTCTTDISVHCFCLQFGSQHFSVIR